MTATDYRHYLMDSPSKIYLAACSHSPPTRRLHAALEEYEHDLLEYGNPWDLWLEKVTIAVRLFSRLINASPEEVFPSFSVSSALGSLLSAFVYGGRSGIVVSDMEYPTTNFIFLAQRRYGAKVKTLRNVEYVIRPDAYSEAIGAQTLLTSAFHVSSMNGFRQDIGLISRIAHEAGSLLYTDAYQSLGAIPVDVRKSRPDFLASGNLKYLLGLPGIAFMYVRRELVRELEPTGIGWFSQKDPFLFGATELRYADTADRFQSGTLSIPSLYAAIEGMKTILEVGADRIEKHVASLTALAIDLASKRGLRTITPTVAEKRGAIVSFVVDKPHETENRLRKEGIITSSRGIGLRIAPHFYNSPSDIETAVERISKLSKV